MKKKTLLFYIITAALMLMLSVTALSADNTQAVTIRLTKTEGDGVSVTSNSGKTVKTSDRMRLFSGYSVGTDEDSYAYMSFDDAKAGKLDRVSKAGIKKAGNKNELYLETGSFYFDVKEKLKDDEEFNVKVSNLTMGIRGTIGVVKTRFVLNKNNKNDIGSRTTIQIFEGSVVVKYFNSKSSKIETATISAGYQMIAEILNDGTIYNVTVQPIKVDQIQYIAAKEIISDPVTIERVETACGFSEMDIQSAMPEIKKLDDEQVVGDRATRIDAEVVMDAQINPPTPTPMPTASSTPSGSSTPNDSYYYGYATATPQPTGPLPVGVAPTTEYNRDVRFAPGYPILRYVTDIYGDVVPEYVIKMVGASPAVPMSIFMNYYGYSRNYDDTASLSVVHGHDGMIQPSNAYYYTPWQTKDIQIADENEHVVQLYHQGTSESTMYFVVRDTVVGDSAVPMRLVQIAPPTSLDPNPVPTPVPTPGPSYISQLYEGYINRAGDTILMYYYDDLDTTSVPAASSYSITAAGISYPVSSVDVVNITDTMSYRGLVKLHLSSPIPPVDRNNIYASYSGTQLRNLAGTRIARTFTNRRVYKAEINYTADAMGGSFAHSSSDGRYIYVGHYGVQFEDSNFVAPQLYDPFNNLIPPGEYTIQQMNMYSGRTSYLIEFNTWSTFNSGGQTFSLRLVPNTIPPGTLDMAQEAVGSYLPMGLTIPISPSPENGQPVSVEYVSGMRALKVSFAANNGLDFDDMYGNIACPFYIQSGGATYNLRGNLVPNTSENAIYFYSDNIPFDPAAFNWNGATLSMAYDTHSHQLSELAPYTGRLRFLSGKTYTGFAPMPIAIN